MFRCKNWKNIVIFLICGNCSGRKIIKGNLIFLGIRISCVQILCIGNFWQNIIVVELFYHVMLYLLWRLDFDEERISRIFHFF